MVRLVALGAAGLLWLASCAQFASAYAGEDIQESGSSAELRAESFSSPTSGWERMHSAEGIMDYDSGGYRMLINMPETQFVATAGINVADSNIQVDAARLAGPIENRIGLVCRKQGEQYYFFLISSDGFYGIGIYLAGRASLLSQSEMIQSDVVLRGTALNHLQASCARDRLSFTVNGIQIATAADERLASGDVGLLGGTFGSPGADILFDNFLVQSP
jgi:hypothetical protein